MRVPIPFVGPSYQNRSISLSAQITRNLYPEINAESKAIVSLNPYPGLVEFARASGRCRGSHVMAGTLYAVMGVNLYSISKMGVATSLGRIDGGSRCDFADNGTQLAIATGGKPYIYDGELSEITDPDLGQPTTVGYINGQFVWDLNPGTGQFITSDVGDASSVSALNFAQAEEHPDDIERVITQNEIVYFLGTDSIDPWYNSGVGSPPFDPVQGGAKSIGIGAKWSAAELNGTFYFIDDSRQPRRAAGFEFQPIGATPALGAAWAKYETIADAIGMAYQLDNQNYYHVTFPTANKTWLYHESSNSWSELADGENGGQYRAYSYANVYDKNLVIDRENGKIYKIDFDAFTNDGDVIQRKRATAVIHGGLFQAPGRQVFFDQVEFVFQVGYGTPAGQGETPVVFIRHSDDNGHTWSSEEEYDIGIGSDYTRRVVLLNQGAAYQRIYEVTETDPVRVAFISAHADIQLGMS